MLALGLGRFGFILNAHGLTFWRRTRDPLQPYKLSGKRFGPFIFMWERVTG